MWLRDGRRVAVGVPPGCLFLQAGRQMEWLTGGAIVGGMHEVRTLNGWRKISEILSDADGGLESGIV